MHAQILGRRSNWPNLHDQGVGLSPGTIAQLRIHRQSQLALKMKNRTKAAGIRKIKFHGVRHTCATLLLQAGTPVHVVAQRLGHAKASMTLDVYAHTLPDMQQDAATRLASVLHG
jgi:integrase